MMPNFTTLIDLFVFNAEAYPNHAAVIVDDKALTHAALFGAIQRQASALAALGVKKGDRVLLIAGNRPEVLVLLGAAAWLGAMLVPLNLRLSEAEMVQQASDALPVVVIVDAAHEAIWNAAWPNGMPNVSRIELETTAWLLFACVGPDAAPNVPRQDEPDVGALMLYTAAVEGHARGAVLSQSQLTASAQQIARVWSLKADDRWLGVLPLFHAAGIGLSLVLLSAGGACVLLPRFDPGAAVAAVARHQITVCATFSPMLTALLDAADTSGASLVSLRIAMGMEPPTVVERLSASSPGMAFWSAYGQAEVSSMVCLGLQSERPGAAGRALAPSQVRIQDLSGQPIPIGVEGEIAVCGPTVFLGYWDVEQRRPFRPAGPWHRTGDLGRLDADGWLWFVGRAPHKQLIKTGGENVYPAEVEQVLLEHPAVAEAFVFGKPDEKWGEAIHAICALRPEKRATADELISFVENRLARYKRPQTVHFMDLPIERDSRRL
jgi:acyl-CoA synthetase (AMP-forming)/AMP-acid ligase II